MHIVLEEWKNLLHISLIVMLIIQFVMKNALNSKVFLGKLFQKKTHTARKRTSLCWAAAVSVNQQHPQLNGTKSVELDCLCASALAKWRRIEFKAVSTGTFIVFLSSVKKKNLCPHENANAGSEALSRACRTNRGRYNLNHKAMLANQKPDKVSSRRR